MDLMEKWSFKQSSKQIEAPKTLEDQIREVLRMHDPKAEIYPPKARTLDPYEIQLSERITQQTLNKILEKLRGYGVNATYNKDENTIKVPQLPPQLKMVTLAELEAGVGAQLAAQTTAYLEMKTLGDAVVRLASRLDKSKNEDESVKLRKEIAEKLEEFKEAAVKAGEEIPVSYLQATWPARLVTGARIEVEQAKRREALAEITNKILSLQGALKNVQVKSAIMLANELKKDAEAAKKANDEFYKPTYEESIRSQAARLNVSIVKVMKEFGVNTPRDLKAQDILRVYARNNLIDYDKLVGTGPDGEVTEEDIKKRIRPKQPKPPKVVPKTAEAIMNKLITVRQCDLPPGVSARETIKILKDKFGGELRAGILYVNGLDVNKGLGVSSYSDKDVFTISAVFGGLSLKKSTKK